MHNNADNEFIFRFYEFLYILYCYNVLYDILRNLALHSANLIIAVMCFVYLTEYPTLADLVFYITASAFIFQLKFIAEVHYEVARILIVHSAKRTYRIE